MCHSLVCQQTHTGTEEVCLVCHSLGCHQTRTGTEGVCLVCHSLGCHQTRTGTEEEVVFGVPFLGCPALRQGILKRSVWRAILWASLSSETGIEEVCRMVCAILWAALSSDTGIDEVCQMVCAILWAAMPSV